MTTEGNNNRHEIHHADINWRDSEQGPQLHCVEFDDIYFSGNGTEETEYVFLTGNDLPDRFTKKPRFHIGELGFGTGLNFLVSWHAFDRTTPAADQQLHYFAVEKYPLTHSNIEKCHRQRAALAPYCATLLHHLPVAARGMHFARLSPNVTLTLYYGDVEDGLAAYGDRADAWFLDGFSPAKNPAMWSTPVMHALARRSRPGTSYATFTAAGHVRAALKEAGFTTQRIAGFGRKRHMTRGALQTPPPIHDTPPWARLHNLTPTKKSEKIVIIGAGIAGAAIAHALRQQERDAQIIDSTGPAAGASGNPGGIIMPRLDLGDTPPATFFRQAYLYCLQQIAHLQLVDQGVFNPCGVIWRARNDEERTRFAKILAAGSLPASHMQVHPDGILFPQGGVIDPKAYVLALLQDIEITKTEITNITHTTNGHILECANGQALKADTVIIATGAQTHLLAKGVALTPMTGQIDHFPNAAAPEQVVASGPYMAPAPQGGLLIGASYEKPGQELPPSQATAENIAALHTLSTNPPTLSITDAQPRRAVRAQTPDRLPCIGPVPDFDFYENAYQGLRRGAQENYPDAEYIPGFYALTGLGSRGLVTAPLAGAMLAETIANGASTISHDGRYALHPARFIVRALKRNQPITNKPNNDEHF